ncbi:probable peroxidase 61 [Vigna umbellata]|uniref:probable peroxidase 61 n=1 Tax=Vigna umbellata TaxID=87088 RepID=UPI001F5E7674|nr:probable peroxidase 61 [Vigna umbellata]
MERSMRVAFPLVVFAVASLCYGMADAAVVRSPPTNLKWHYYKISNTCRDAEEYVRHQVKLFWDSDRSITAKLLRLVYTDCFVTGCDASILLDEGPNPEKKAAQNRGLGGFVAIDKIKYVLESRCPGKVSCADILHLATRDAVHLAGGPSYPVLTGRKDSSTSDAASVDLPSPSISLQELLVYFRSRNLNEVHMTTLLGAHTLGRTHCSYIVDRLYNYAGTGKPDPSMSATLLESLRKLCPPRKKGQPDPLVYLNPESGSNYNFTESYYRRILSNDAVLGVDQQLLNGNNTKQITEEFAAGFEDFRKNFAAAMYQMGNFKVLTGNQGEIRKNCRYANK